MNSESIDSSAEQISEDIAKAFNAWIRPELAKVIGWPAVEKIQDMDFEAVLQAQYKALSIKRTHTVRKNGADFHFKLYQGFPPKPILLSKFTYRIDFQAYENTPQDS